MVIIIQPQELDGGVRMAWNFWKEEEADGWSVVGTRLDMTQVAGRSTQKHRSEADV